MATPFRNLMAYMAGLLTSLRLFLAITLMPEITELQEDNSRLARRNRILREDKKELMRRLEAATPFSQAGLADHARHILNDPRLYPFHEGALLILALTAKREVRTSTETCHPADRWGVPGIFFSDHPAWKRRLDHRTGLPKPPAASAVPTTA